MAHARDADDALYLADGDHAALLAKYAPVVLGRCFARIRDRHTAEDIAQNVMVRLAGELQRGKSYGDLPYRVVVARVIGGTIQEHSQGRASAFPLPEGWEPVAPDELEGVLARHDLRAAFAAL